MRDELGLEGRYLGLIARGFRSDCPLEAARAFQEAEFLRMTVACRPGGAAIGEMWETSGDSLRRMMAKTKGDKCNG